MLKPCYQCRRLIPAEQFAAHKDQHHNAVKPRRPGSWDRARRRALQRDRYRCRRCGRTQKQLAELGIQLHVHHIDGDSRNNRLDNLITLCDPHHPRGGSQKAIP